MQIVRARRQGEPGIRHPVSVERLKRTRTFGGHSWSVPTRFDMKHVRFSSNFVEGHFRLALRAA